MLELERQVNKEPIERVYPSDERVKPQTLAHHIARYNFAIAIRPPEGMALDIASGAGYGTEMLRIAGYKTRGIEIDSEAIEYARKNYPDNEFIQGDITESLPEGKYNLITFFEAIEHLDEENGLKVLQDAGVMLLDDGVMIVSTPRDINEENNGFHKSKWTYDKLKDVLSQRFSDMTILGQDWDTAEIKTEDVRGEDFYIAVCRKD